MKTIKNNKDLERWRGTFFQAGLIVTLALCLLAFEWKTEQGLHSLSDMRPLASIMEDMAPITVHKPPVPPAPKPRPVTIFEQVDDKITVLDEVFIDVGDDPFKAIEAFDPVILPEPEPAGEDFFRVVEEMPSFPGGLSAMLAYLKGNIRYPEQARTIGISGTVYIGFIVHDDGQITNAEVLRGIGGGCDEEALRVVRNMPSWSPGKQRGKAVRVAMSIPVRFVLL